MKTKHQRNFISIIFLTIISVVFFYRFFLYRLIPFPGDLLVGAYYPWLDYQWGNLVTHVPIKNPLISDVFSQFFLWKKIAIESFKNFQWPLWNPYSYSGYPLLANFHSGVFNPFNLLMLFLPLDIGWGFLVFSQFILSAIFMYLFLKQIYSSKFSALIGSIIYGFNGFIITWSQFVTAGFAMVWLPLIFLNIYLYFKTKRFKHLLYLSPLYFLLMTSGHFQSLIFGCLFSGFYFIWKLLSSTTNKIKSIKLFSFAVILGILLMSTQIIPTLEMSRFTIRSDEGYIAKYNFGLLSPDRIITLFAPDYFGNPATYNFWGTYNYHETVVYCSVLAVFTLIFALFQFKHLKEEKFFLIASLATLLLAFSNPLSKLIYQLKIPALSTASAGRIIILFTFSVSILSAYLIQKISLQNFKNTLRYFWGYFAYLIIISLTTFSIYRQTISDDNLSHNFYIGLRNLILPGFVSLIIFLILAFIKNSKLKCSLLILITIIDLFRFGWKYLPFTSHNYLFPNTDITDFLQKQPGVFRIEKERDALMPSNTWINYHLSSTSGYDPMALNQYSLFYDQLLNQSSQPISTRYSEIDKYDAQSLGESNVKYLLVLKRQKDNNQLKVSSSGDQINPQIDLNDWHQIYQSGSVAILENQKFKPRIEIKGSSGSINNLLFASNQISFQTETSQNTTLILRDTWYPGWQATIDNHPVPINLYQKIYRQIDLPSGKHQVQFLYHPKTFYYGLYISLSTLALWSVFVIKFKHKQI